MTLIFRVWLGLSLAVLATPARDCSAGRTSKAASQLSPAAVPVPTARPDPFVSVVRPILTAHCAPCHEPGGKMYERLPFDQARTIAEHSEGVLRRLKGDDRDAVEKWLASLPERMAPPKG
ncbi:MAG TPA: hypothetical protein VGL03_04855 [Thermoanaerobaculia bacterium]